MDTRAGFVVVDDAFLELIKTKRGGYKQAQLQILGVDWPPKKGWKQQVWGMLLAMEDAETLVKLRT